MRSPSLDVSGDPLYGLACCAPAPHAGAITRRRLLALGAAGAAGLFTRPVWADAAPAALRAAIAGAGDTDLDVALAAARWIRRSRIETAHGVTWPADPLKPDSVEPDLYNGMPGVVLFHLELFHATGDRLWLDDARAGADEMIAQIPALDASEDCGLYSGLAGFGFVLEETHRATGEGRYRDAATRCLTMIERHAAAAGSGVAWAGGSAANDIISGSAGIGCFLLWAADRIGDGRRIDGLDAVGTAAAAGRRLIEAGIPAAGGTKWAVAPTVKNLYPNFSHGAAGVSYFLATLYQRTGDRAFLDAALSGARYLQAVATTDDGGFKVFHHEPGGEDLFYLSWCHGPAGASRLFWRLAEVTGDERWRDVVRRGATATIASGLPERRSPGFWNNISQCCGNSGVGEWFLTLDRLMPDPAYAAMTRRVAADTLRRATADGNGSRWIQAENRVQPEVVIAQTGFMQGAAGVGTMFLHLAAARSGRRPPPIAWPDTPFA